MKGFIALVLCLALLLSFSACGKKDRFEDEEVLFDITAQGEQSSQEESEDILESESGEESSSETSEDTQQDNSETESSDSSSPQKPSTQDKDSDTQKKDKITGIELIKMDGHYFPEIDDLYVPAAQIYYELTSGNLPVDWDMGRYEFTVEGSTNTYWRISDSRFDSVAELEAYLNAYFTEDFIKTFYDASLFHDHEGHLYAVTGVSGDNILYAGCEFKLTKQTTKRIFFDCISYFYKYLEEIPAENKPFNKAPKDTSKYNSKTVSFVLEVDESGYNWKFSKFDNIK